MIPFAIALFIYQTTLRDYLDRIKNEVKQETSQDLYLEFLQQKKGSSRYYELLAKSLKLKLVESGQINAADISEQLPANGSSGEVRAFLNEIEEKRFSRAGELIPADLESKAQALMLSIDSKKGAQP